MTEIFSFASALALFSYCLNALGQMGNFTSRQVSLFEKNVRAVPFNPGSLTAPQMVWLGEHLRDLEHITLSAPRIIGRMLFPINAFALILLLFSAYYFFTSLQVSDAFRLGGLGFSLLLGFLILGLQQILYRSHMEYLKAEISAIVRPYRMPTV